MEELNENADAKMVVGEKLKHPSEVLPIPQSAHSPKNGRFAAMAPYWLDGLHNLEGLELAEKINRLIAEKNLEENEEAIAAVIKTFASAAQFKIGVFSEEYYLNDPHLKANLAQPVKLLQGALVRDKDGAYRPAEGGRPVVVDKGDSIAIKDKNQGPSAIVELAMAKGWAAIELTGSKKTKEKIWLQAAFAGLVVVGYEPSKEAQAKLADMFISSDLEIANRSASQQIQTEGTHSGKIMEVKNGIAVQKIGRDPDVVVRHELNKLSREPSKGEVVQIEYADGLGKVSEKEIGCENSLATAR